MKHYLTVSLSVIALTLANLSLAAPITFNTALPVSKGQSILREQFIYKQASNANTESNQASLVTSVIHGISANTTLFATLPVTYTSFDTPSQDSSDKGIGDLRLSIRHTVFQKNDTGKTFRVAPFAGIELATSDNEFGHSSNDIFTGLIVTYGTTDWTIDSQISYQYNGHDGELNIGNTITFDASLQYRIIPVALTASTTAFLNGVIELNIIKQHSNKTKQRIINNSADTSTYLSPGLQYITRRWIAEASLQVPISSNNNIADNDYIARAGIRINF